LEPGLYRAANHLVTSTKKLLSGPKLWTFVDGTRSPLRDCLAPEATLYENMQ